MKEGNLLLDIKDLHVHYQVYGGKTKVIDGIDFQVEAGKKIGLVGESGCGKTTMVRSVMQVLPTQARIPKGEVFFDGDALLKISKRDLNRVRGQKMSMIFQDPTASLNPVFTIGSQIEDTIRYSGMVKGNDKKVIHERAIQALKDCSMPDPERLLKCYPFELSGGMRQRVCIAMALATASKLMIADEPTTNLDVTIQDQVLRLIRQLCEKKNMSLILITHSLGVARMMTDWIYVMYAGQIVEKAVTSRIFEHPYHPYTVGLMESIPKLTGEGIMEGISGKLPNYLNPPKGCRFQDRCKKVMEKCRNCKPRLFPVEENHQVACFLYERGRAEDPEVSHE